MKEVITIYSCDVCEKQFRQGNYPDELEQIPIMGFKWHDSKDEFGPKGEIAPITCDVCKECKEKLYNITKEYIGDMVQSYDVIYNTGLEKKKVRLN